jgi:cytochrome c5
MNRVFLPLFLSAFALLSGQAVLAQSAAKVLKTGEQVYNQTCVACHASGVANAPKFKDAAAWKPLIAEGQHILSSHALVGVRAMPAKGGAADLSVAEFSNAVAYMVRNAGGDWKDVDAAMLTKIAKEGSKRLELSMRQSAALKRELQKLHGAK